MIIALLMVESLFTPILATDEVNGEGETPVVTQQGEPADPVQPQEPGAEPEVPASGDPEPLAEGGSNDPAPGEVPTADVPEKTVEEPGDEQPVEGETPGAEVPAEGDTPVTEQPVEGDTPAADGENKENTDGAAPEAAPALVLAWLKAAIYTDAKLETLAEEDKTEIVLTAPEETLAECVLYAYPVECGAPDGQETVLAYRLVLLDAEGNERELPKENATVQFASDVLRGKMEGMIALNFTLERAEDAPAVDLTAEDPERIVVMRNYKTVGLNSVLVELGAEAEEIDEDEFEDEYYEEEWAEAEDAADEIEGTAYPAFALTVPAAEEAEEPAETEETEETEEPEETKTEEPEEVKTEEPEEVKTEEPEEVKTEEPEETKTEEPEETKTEEPEEVKTEEPEEVKTEEPEEVKTEEPEEVKTEEPEEVKTEEPEEVKTEEPEDKEDEEEKKDEEPEEPQPTGVVYAEGTEADEYLTLEVTGGEEAYAELSAVSPVAASSKQILAAYTFGEHSEDASGILATLSAVPELEDGEVLAFYGIAGGRLEAEPVTDTEAAFDFAGYEGFALVKLIPSKQELRGKLELDEGAEAWVSLTGVFPAEAKLTLAAAEYEQGDEDVLLAVDAQVIDLAGNAFKPAQGEEILVTVRAEALGNRSLKLHLGEEALEITAENGAVAFSADALGSFVIAEEVEIVTATYSGRAVQAVANSVAGNLEYWFLSSTASLNEVAAALGLVLTEDEYALSVDDDRVDLSAAVCGKTADVTLTAMNYFESACLTLTGAEQIVVIELNYPEPDTIVYTFRDAAETLKLNKLLTDNGFNVLSIDEADVTAGTPSNVILTSQEGEWTVAQAAQFDALTLTVISGGRVICLVELHCKKDTVVLVDRKAPEEAIWHNDDLYLTGKTPRNAVIVVKPVEVEIEGAAALLAYDITIFANSKELRKNNAWQPAGDAVQVHFYSEEFSNDVDVYHLTDVEAAPEYIGTVSPENGWITFDAESFSVYAVAEHEGGEVLVPRVEFHFIADGALSHTEGGSVYYEGTPYTFRNKNNELQTTQILADGETLELIADPANRNEDNRFFGWYTVDPKVIDGVTDAWGVGTGSPRKLYYTWPAYPSPIAFEVPVSVSLEDGVVIWDLDGLSGTGEPDEDGCVHVFLAPLFDKYHFINFMLQPYDPSAPANNKLMARKMVALGSAETTEVKISDVASYSQDPTHLIFIGWEYYDRTEERWQQYLTLDYSGAPITSEGRDGVYVSLSTADEVNMDLYPVFVEARWVDFVSGASGSGATYVPSRFLESWGPPTPANMEDEPGTTVFASLDMPTRTGYDFGGWYAFAVTDPNTGEILNLTEPADFTFTYIDIDDGHTVKTVTVQTAAVKIAQKNAGGVEILNCGLCSVEASAPDPDTGICAGTLHWNGDAGQQLFRASDGKLRLYDALDRLKLSANWLSGASKITIVYWTENALDKGMAVDPEVPEKEYYTASAVKTVTTAEISDSLGTTYTSGSEISLADLRSCRAGDQGILDTAYLDDAGAVLTGEEIFYDLNEELSDASKIVSGDGSTVFNVYYSRKVFTIVFHIGRDGYVKTGGSQKETDRWNPYGNWIQYMFKDGVLADLLRPVGGECLGSNSFKGTFELRKDGVLMSDSTYVTTLENIMGDYLPAADENLYVIRAKYGAYIGDRWPTPGKNGFTFTCSTNPGDYTMYTWAGYYDSLYCRIANERPTWAGQQGNNPDFNGVYEYMSKEVCSNRAGDAVINENQVHHLVAYFGKTSNNKRFKTYHILYEAIPGTYDPDSVTTVPGSDYASYNRTTWSSDIAHVDASVIEDRTFFEVRTEEVISNVNPEFQMAWELDGYEYFYSCYTSTNNGTHNDVYFFYTPKQHTLTFMYENPDDRKTDTYYYTQTLADAKKPEYADPEREGWRFLGWYTNEAGIGEPFDFASETMPNANVVLYPVMNILQYFVKIDPNGGVIDHINYDSANPDYYGNYANQFGVTGTGYNSSQATYFTADYGTPIGEYTVGRGYMPLSDRELDPSDPAYYTGEKYYYVNTQYNEGSDGDWGLPPNLRNAVYLTEQQLACYYAFYRKVATDNLGYYTGVTVLQTFDEFAAAYTGYPDQPCRPIGSDGYTFMGWYQVFDDGSVSTMPYNFNDPVTGELTLRAKWRLNQGFYIQYHPLYVDETDGEVTVVNGEMDQWTDPENPTLQLYADQSLTRVLHAPTNYQSEWIFRGWRVVRGSGTRTYTVDGEELTLDVWTPVQLDAGGNPIYYQPGASFTVDSSYYTEIAPNGVGRIIHMQAVYERYDVSVRRPEVTNLILDANGGYVTDGSAELTSDANLPWDEAGTVFGDAAADTISFGDIQSNTALHLTRFAKDPKYFGHSEGHFLLGFDPAANEGDYIAHYAADSVISVQRTDHETLYAVWEPMLYVTFVNTTDHDITVDLGGTNAAASIVNLVTGEFDRERTTDTVTVPARSGDTNGTLRIVLPAAEPGTDEVTATAVNSRLGKRLSVEGSFGTETPYGTGSAFVRYGGSAVYTGVMRTDAQGIVVTYTEEDDPHVVFDVNGGVWRDTEPFMHMSGDVYILESAAIQDHGGSYEPADPERAAKLFIGWMTNADIAAHTDFSAVAAVSWGGHDHYPKRG
ncbi:MAG: InlB B-repeat-containing protein [Clostridia bacterium]|nr:InlB B-repeat-containing protein [Clostridia bacterium]